MDTLENLQPEFHRTMPLADGAGSGYIVIDKFLSGCGTGGIRITDDVTIDEVARLAHEMTLKFGLLNIPRGGAKAGLVIPHSTGDESRAKICREFGAAIGDLLRDRKYIPGLDLGTSKRDLANILEGAGLPGEVNTANNSIDSNFYTALTVSVAALALLQERQLEASSVAVAIEGFGHVGTHFATLMQNAGAKIVAISNAHGAIRDTSGLDIDVLIAAKEKSGDTFITELPGIECLPRETLFETTCDLLVPGARPDSINADNIDNIPAKYIVPIANICATREMEAALNQRGIDFVPGFVSNSGGIFCWFVERLAEDARLRFFDEDFRDMVGRLVREADRRKTAISTVCREKAAANLQRMRDEESGVLASRLAALGRTLSWRRLGFVVGSKLFGPGWIRTNSALARRYFDSRYLR